MAVSHGGAAGGLVAGDVVAVVAAGGAVAETITRAYDVAR